MHVYVAGKGVCDGRWVGARGIGGRGIGGEGRGGRGGENAGAWDEVGGERRQAGGRGAYSGQCMQVCMQVL